MKKLFILFILATSLTTNSHAGERKWNMNLFDEKGVLMQFHIGGVFCDKYNNIWNDKCQDALLEDVYGHIWPEVKQIILDFQKAVAENDYRYLKGKTVIPEEKLAVNVRKALYEEASGGLRFVDMVADESYIVREKKLNKIFSNKMLDNLRKTIKNIKYEDMRVHHIWSDGIEFNDKCEIRFKLISENIGGKYIWHYIPKIDLISFDFAYLGKEEIFLSGS
jgi:hypothetical protein